MTLPIIDIDNLGKSYLIRHETDVRHNTLRDAMVDGLKKFGRRLSKGDPFAGDARERFWALRDVSFRVNKGEVIGVIGHNGAGKSTLLKLLSRITEPSEGRITLRGRVASLLEVGTGFHPELTGRENVFLNGCILGMSRQEIAAKFDEIVAFAEVERFLDTPVKRYSSGMMVRLAFAVAAHLDPEILVVDEVLAVGDIRFQNRCLGKMQEVASGSGRTVLFVSHNMAMINSLCQRAVLLRQGRVECDKPIKEAIEQYLKYAVGGGEGEGDDQQAPVHATDGPVELLEFEVRGDDGQPRTLFKSTEDVNLHIRYKLNEPLEGLRVGFDLVSLQVGDALFRSFDDDERERPREPGEHVATARIPGSLLLAGLYVVHLRVGIHMVRWMFKAGVARRFTVKHIDGLNSRYADDRPGMILPQVTWSAPQ